MNSPESPLPDPTTPAIYDVITTMQGGEGAPGAMAGDSGAATPPDEGESVAPAFGVYRRPFGEGYVHVPILEQKAAGALFGEEVEAIVNEYGGQKDRMFDGSELRCVCRYGNDVRQLVVTQTRGGTHIIISEGEKGHGARFSYGFGPDGEVRRIDRQERTETEEALHRRGHEETRVSLRSTREERAAAVVALMRQAHEFKEQMEAEARLGINNLPVGSDEIRALIADVRFGLAHRVS